MKMGIDMGGSKIEGLVLDGDGNEQARRRVATPVGDYDGAIATVAGLIAELAGETGYPDGGRVGVGIPGAVSPATGLIKNANSTCLIGRRLGDDLQAATGRPVRLANDADCRFTPPKLAAVHCIVPATKCSIKWSCLYLPKRLLRMYT